MIMGPKVFISSTYYDLKYIREDLDQFVKSYKFETVLFERGDIGYTPGSPLDESCYSYISKSDMVILVVGGLYGSPATGETSDNFKEYLSITRKEFQAAKDANIPIFVFIDSDVDAEYFVYKKNLERIENCTTKIDFNATQNINVFRFIHLIRNYSNVVVNTFKRSSDIKEYLANQWAGFFLNYLELLKEDRQQKKIENSLDILQINIDKINLMVDKMGEEFLSQASVNDYQTVKNQQTISTLKNIIFNCFTVVPFFVSEEDQEKFVINFVSKLASMMKDKSFYLYASSDLSDQEEFYDAFNFKDAIIEKIKPGTEIELRDYVDQLQNPATQKELTHEILKDKRCWKVGSLEHPFEPFSPFEQMKRQSKQ